MLFETKHLSVPSMVQMSLGLILLHFMKNNSEPDDSI